MRDSSVVAAVGGLERPVNAGHRRPRAANTRPGSASISTSISISTSTIHPRLLRRI